jgi:hypothetical protein
MEMKNLVYRSIYVHTSKRFLTCRKILRHGAYDITSTQKKGKLRILLSLKPSLSAGIDTTNLGSNCKHYTTDNDDLVLIMTSTNLSL